MTIGVEVGGIRGGVVTSVIAHQYKQDKYANTFDLGKLLFHCFFLQALLFVSNPGLNTYVANVVWGVKSPLT